MDNIVNDTKTFLREEDIPPAKPLSIMLTNHKINVGVTKSTELTDDTDLMDDPDDTSDPNMIASNVKSNGTSKNDIFIEPSSTSPSSDILSDLDDTKLYAAKEDIEGSGLELEHLGEHIIVQTLCTVYVHIIRTVSLSTIYRQENTST